MNQSLLKNFREELDFIEKYLEHIDLINEIAKKSKNSNDDLLINLYQNLKDFSSSKKVFEYKSIIISIYGLLEKYISLWIKDFIEDTSKKVKKYETLSDKFKKSHYEQTIQLLLKIIEGKNSKFEGIDEKLLISNINSCINGLEDFSLNVDSFVPFSGNLKHNIINLSFKSFDINLEAELKKDLKFSNYLEINFGKNYTNKESEILFEKINNLVDRRNLIAHGSEIDDILEKSEIVELIEFLRLYCESIFSILDNNSIKYELEDFRKIESTNIIDVFNNEILAIEVNNFKVKLGDYIIVRKSDESFEKNQIIEIQIDKKSFNEIDIYSNTKIAIKVDKTIKKNFEYYINKNTIIDEVNYII